MRSKCTRRRLPRNEPTGHRGQPSQKCVRRAMMFQIRIHGRGGQGVVSGAEMLSVAAFLGGGSAPASPSCGLERMGGRVMAFCRIDEKEIGLPEPVLEPDALIV